MQRLQDSIWDQNKIFFAGLSGKDVVTMENGVRGLGELGIVSNAFGVGSKAPDFTLPNARAEAVNLYRKLEDGPVVITFYLGSWSSVCDLQLKAYDAIVPLLREMDCTLLGICPEQRSEISLGDGEKKGDSWGFDLLSDYHNYTARRFRLVYQLEESVRGIYRELGIDLARVNEDASWTLPLAGTYVIAPGGEIVWSFVRSDYRFRPEPLDILKAVHELAVVSV